MVLADGGRDVLDLAVGDLLLDLLGRLDVRLVGLWTELPEADAFLVEPECRIAAAGGLVLATATARGEERELPRALR